MFLSACQLPSDYLLLQLSCLSFFIFFFVVHRIILWVLSLSLSLSLHARLVLRSREHIATSGLNDVLDNGWINFGCFMFPLITVRRRRRRILLHRRRRRRRRRGLYCGEMAAASLALIRRYRTNADCRRPAPWDYDGIKCASCMQGVCGKADLICFSCRAHCQFPVCIVKAVLFIIIIIFRSKPPKG